MLSSATTTKASQPAVQHVGHNVGQLILRTGENEGVGQQWNMHVAPPPPVPHEARPNRGKHAGDHRSEWCR